MAQHRYRTLPGGQAHQRLPQLHGVFRPARRPGLGLSGLGQHVDQPLAASVATG
jgi:hypothetical protein